MQKAKQENTRFVASCSTKKYPFSLFLKKFQKLKWNSGHRYVAEKKGKKNQLSRPGAYIWGIHSVTSYQVLLF